MNLWHVWAIFAGTVACAVSAGMFVTGARRWLIGVFGGLVIITLAVVEAGVATQHLVAEAFEKGKREGCTVGVLDHRGPNAEISSEEWFVRGPGGEYNFHDTRIMAPFVEGKNVVRICFGQNCGWYMVNTSAKPAREGPSSAR